MRITEVTVGCQLPWGGPSLLLPAGFVLGALLTSPDTTLAARAVDPGDPGFSVARPGNILLSSSDVRERHLKPVDATPRSRFIVVAQAAEEGDPGRVVDRGDGFIGEVVHGSEGTEVQSVDEKPEELFDVSSTVVPPVQLPIVDVYIEEALTEEDEDLLTTVTITPDGEVQIIELPQDEKAILEGGSAALKDLFIPEVTGYAAGAPEERGAVVGKGVRWRDVELVLPSPSRPSIAQPGEGELKEGTEAPTEGGEGKPELPGQGTEAPTEGNLGIPKLGVAIESIIGRDDRFPVTSTTDYPLRAIGRISIGCTGTLIGPRHVLTAGHCVYNIKDDRWYSKLDFGPGQNGSVRPYGTIGWARAITVEGWRKYHRRDYDYAMIVLKEDVGNQLGTFGYLWRDPMPLYNVNVIGYPGDKPETAWGSFCRLEMIQPFRIYYPCDSLGGMSGSAVFKKDADGKRLIYGIHAYGVDETSFNGATRITKSLFENLNRWKEQF